MVHTTAIKNKTERSRVEQLLMWLNAERNAIQVPGVSRPALERLRAYVQSWTECAPNAILWRERFPAHWQAICRSLSKTQLILYPAVDGCIGAWDLRPGVSSSRSADLWRADKLFADFLTDFHNRIAVCQRAGCGLYFEVNPKKRSYCSERCGRMATSRLAKSAKRHNDRHGRMIRVLDFLRKLSMSKHRDFLATDGSDETPAWAGQAIRSVKGVTARWLNEAILERLPTPENFAGCARCREIRAQIQKVLEQKREA